VTTADTDPDAPVISVGRLVQSVSEVVHSESEAKWLVAEAAGIAPGTLLSSLDRPVPTDVVDAVHLMAQRRAGGEPLQYVLGTWSFRHLEVAVDPRALVPRPETEQVVEVALEELRRRADLDGEDRKTPYVVVDLGTGTGVIALSLALEAMVDVEVWATDASPTALALARANLSRLGALQPAAAARVRLVAGSWFDALPHRLAGHLQLVVSNPPYVSAAEWADLDPEVREHEPRPALVSGDTGLEALDLLLDQARQWLAPGGSIVFELAPHQSALMAARAGKAGYLDVRVRPDLAGRERALSARWPGAR
jgi:release factor glutamine methyltransferase